jgi:hypothetical protein
MMTFTTRSWSGTAVLLCALLLQNCQSNSLRATREEEPTTSPSSASIMRQRTSREHLAMRSSTPLSVSLAARGSSSSLSTIPAHEEDRSTALPSRALLPSVPSTLATMSNSPTAPYHLPASVMPEASRAFPLGNAPGAFSPVFTTSSGERVSFIQVDGQWRAAMQAGYGVVTTLQRTLPVVGPADVGNFLFWLQGQDKWTSRARIHILKMPQAPYGFCVYLGRAGLLGGVPASSRQEVDQESRTVPRMAFGAKEWRDYYGEVGEEPELPGDIEATLKAPCPFWSRDEKKVPVRDTHLLVLIPATVDGAPFTLNLLKELIERPKNGEYYTKYNNYDDDVRAKIGAVSPPASYWLLMTRDVLPESRKKKYAEQKRLVTGPAERYQLPKALEAATAILTHYVRDGEQLYGEEQGHLSTFTSCQDSDPYTSKRKYATVVGGFGSSGLYVRNPGPYTPDYSRGVAACRKVCIAKSSKKPPANKQSLSTVPFASRPSLFAPPTPITTVDDNAASPVPTEVVTASRAKDACSQDNSCWGPVEGDKWEDISVFTGIIFPETVTYGTEFSKQPTKRPSSDPRGMLANKQARCDERAGSGEAAEEENESVHLSASEHFWERQEPESDFPEDDMAHSGHHSPVTPPPHVDHPQPDSKPRAQSRVSPSLSVAGSTSMSVNSSSTSATSTAAPLREEEMDLSPAAMQALLSKKLANPNHALSDQESVALLTHCIAKGARNAEKIKGKDALVVMGNTGAGKSTFLNYLLGCKLELADPAAYGLASLKDIVVVSRDSLVKEAMPIGHQKISKTFIPQIEIDRSDARVAYCDCPGFLDNRGAELNIANAVNIRRVLQSAQSTKVLILINYHSLLADRSRGLRETLLICSQLFGSNVENLARYQKSLLLGITQSPSTMSLVRLRHFLTEDESPIMETLAERIFLYDPLDSGLGAYLSRSACREALSKLEGISQSESSKLFRTVLSDSDECALVRIVESQSTSLCGLLDSGHYAQAASRWQALEQLRVIDNLSVERLLHMSATRLSDNFSKLKSAFKDACYFYNASKSEELLDTLSQIAGHFSEEVCGFSLSELQDHHIKSRERHAEQERKRLADEAAIRAAASEREQLLAAIETQKKETAAELTTLKEEHQKEQNTLREEMNNNNKRYAEQVERLQKELTEALEKIGKLLSLQELSLDERDRLLNEKKRTLEQASAEKLLEMEKERKASEQAYKKLLEEQQASQQATQALLDARITELSRRQTEEEEQLQSLRIPAMAFGAKEWQQYYGKVEPVPDLPSNMDEILDSACPFWPDRKVRDTHLLVLLPATVDGKPFTLALLKELIERPKSGGHRTEYSHYDSAVKKQLGAVSPAASYWLLMTRDVLPGSLYEAYADQKALVAGHTSRTGLPYELPKVLEAATAILTHHVRNGERLYSDNPYTYTRCQELIQSQFGEYPAVVGGFAAAGLLVCGSDYAYDRNGVAGFRKF